MPDYMDGDMRHDIMMRYAEAAVEEELKKPASGSSIELDSDELIELCALAQRGVRIYREAEKRAEIAEARLVFAIQNMPSWFGRLFGLKPKPLPSDEWLYDVFLRGGGPDSHYGGEVAKRLASRLLIAAAHAEAVRVSVEDLEGRGGEACVPPSLSEVQPRAGGHTPRPRR